MAEYSPYDNVKAQDYPALLVTAGWSTRKRCKHAPLPCHVFLLPFVSFCWSTFLLAYAALSHDISSLSSNLHVLNYLIPVSAPVRSERPSRGVLGARQVGGKAAGDEDRRSTAALQNRHVFRTFQVTALDSRSHCYLTHHTNILPVPSYPNIVTKYKYPI